MKILRRLLVDNASTGYGQSLGLTGVRTYEDFRTCVPIVEYDELAPWIERIKDGEQAVLTRDPVTHLVPTSGSTGGRKLIPFTAGFQRQLNQAIGTWVFSLFSQQPSLILGPGYWSISPAIAKCEEKSAVPIGFESDSSYLGGFRQRLAEATFAVPSELAKVSDVECSRYLTLLCLLRKRDLRMLSVWHPSFLALLLDALPGHWDELLEDIRIGGCKRARSFDPKVRAAVEAPPHPVRARELRESGPYQPTRLWPKLSMLSCWGDAQATFARRDLERRLSGVKVEAKGLLATEAFVSIPFGGRHPLCVTSHFFEFADETGAIHLAHQLKKGVTYSVIVTTAAGLWRYRIGDLVTVDGFVGGTPSLRFLGRGRSVSDISGEKLAEAFVTRAIAAACEATGFIPSFAMLAPEKSPGDSWHYTLFVQGELPPGMADCLESELRKNPHYALCRDLGQLGSSQCWEVGHGAYEMFCESNCRDQKLGDIKPQSLSTRSDWRNIFGSKSVAGSTASP